MFEFAFLNLLHDHLLPLCVYVIFNVVWRQKNMRNHKRPEDTKEQSANSFALEEVFVHLRYIELCGRRKLDCESYDLFPFCLLPMCHTSGSSRPKFLGTGLGLRRLHRTLVIVRILIKKLSDIFTEVRQLVDEWLHSPRDGVYDLEMKY